VQFAEPGDQEEEARRETRALREFEDEFDAEGDQHKRQVRGADDEDEYEAVDPFGGVEDDDDDDGDKAPTRMTKKFKWEVDQVDEEVSPLLSPPFRKRASGVQRYLYQTPCAGSLTVQRGRRPDRALQPEG
jgi:hypothetical protein